jgi:hypothetical protein
MKDQGRDSAKDEARPEQPLNLLEFARIVKDGSEVSEQAYVDLMRRVLPIDELKELTPEEGEWFHMAVAWLHDYSILLFEFGQSEKGQRPVMMESPWLPGVSGPYIDHMLVRAHGEAPDFAQLTSFGVREVQIKDEGPDSAQDEAMPVPHDFGTQFRITRASLESQSSLGVFEELTRQMCEAAKRKLEGGQ